MLTYIFIVIIIQVKRDMKLGNVCYDTQHKKASNHHANLPLEMYSFTL